MKKIWSILALDWPTVLIALPPFAVGAASHLMTGATIIGIYIYVAIATSVMLLIDRDLNFKAFRFWFIFYGTLGFIAGKLWVTFMAWFMTVIR